MDYPQQQSKEEVEEWWLMEPDPEATKERLVEQIEALQSIPKQPVPIGLAIKQLFAGVYFMLCITIIFVSVKTPHLLISLLFSIPLSVMLADYFLLVMRVKEAIVKGGQIK